jgi:hypothetical protein
MLQSIDTLITFVVIMTVASLFVTILVQMVSAALSLRGKNLANALALTFQTIAPSLQGDAHALSARILSDPLLSDSTRTPKNKLESLVATVAQRCVPWHFRNIKDATRLANAVRPEEVYAALKRLAEDQNDPEAKKLLAALFVSQEEAETIKTHLSAFRAIADEIADAPTRQKLLAAVEETPANLLVQADAARLKFDAWFTTAQDRAQQWFQVHARGLTIGASFLIAFVFQLDAVEIFHHVSISPAARNALVTASQTVVQHAGESLQQVDAASLQQKQKLIAQLDRQVNESGFDLVPIGFWRWRTELPETPQYSPGWYYFWSYWRHSFGMLLCAGLLTLGAPYWYNLLKNLMSLRPALAQVIGKEEAVESMTAK